MLLFKGRIRPLTRPCKPEGYTCDKKKIQGPLKPSLFEFRFQIITAFLKDFIRPVNNKNVYETVVIFPSEKLKNKIFKRSF